MRELIILGTASQVPTRTRTQRPVIELRSIQIRPDFVHGRSVRFTRYLFEQQSSPSHVEVSVPPLHADGGALARNVAWRGWALHATADPGLWQAADADER